MFGSVVPTCGYCSEEIFLFLATELHETQQNFDADEDLSLFWLPLDEAISMVEDGRINDSKTVSALLRAKIELNQK